MVNANAAGDDYLKYQLNASGDAYTLINCSSSVKGAIEIPAEYKNLPVNEIAANSFVRCTGITSLKIPDSVKTIGELAFYDCSALKTVNIGKGLTIIGDYAFNNCDALTDIIVSDDNESFSSVEGVLFNKDKSVIVKYPVAKVEGEYTIPESVVSISAGAFRGATNLVTISIPDTVKTIGSAAFYNSGYSNKVANWENGVLYIGSHLVASNKNVVKGKYTVKSGTLTIANQAFSDCDNVTEIVLPESLAYIGDGAFEGCESLEKLSMGKNIVSIGEKAFYSCEGLCSINIPATTEEIGNGAFYFCSSLKTISVDDENKFYSSDSFALLDKVKKELIQYSAAVKEKSYTIPDSVITIGNYAFYGSENLTSVNIPDTVKTIGDEAFYNCTDLKYIEIPSSVKIIGERAFGYWSMEDSDSKVDEFIVYGKKDSQAQVYAKNNGFTFVKNGNLPAPEKLTVKNTAGGVKISWAVVPGADGYIIYYKKKGDSYARLVKVRDGLVCNYTDKNAKSGKYYYYTVKAYKGSVKSLAPSGVGVRCVSKPYFSSVSNSGSGVKLKWNKITGVDGYIIYRKTTTSGYERIHKIKGASVVSYTDKTAKPGVTYTYVIKAYSSGTTSVKSDALKIKRLSTPVLKSISKSSSGVTVKWNKVKGAEGYIVYRKTDSGKWTRIEKVSNSNISCLDNTAKKGIRYSYTVVAYSGKYKSSFDSKGLKITR